MKSIKNILYLIACTLLSINFFGLFQSIEPKNFIESDLRFIKNEKLSYLETLNILNKKIDENDIEFSIRINKVIFDRMSHIKWNELEDVDKYNQRIPIWENYILYGMSLFTNIPEYKKYHFADYERSLKRGIGVCGDHSMILSQILDKNGISNKIITIPGHVVVLAEIQKNNYIFDPDFGVYIDIKSNDFKSLDLEKISKVYIDAGFNVSDVDYLIQGYGSVNFESWYGTSHFITKKYYFEYISYFLKWFIPLFLIIIARIKRYE